MDRCVSICPKGLFDRQSWFGSGVILCFCALSVASASPHLLVGWASMLVNCATAFLMLKQLVWIASPEGSRSASAEDRAAFYLLWPGMDVAAFLSNRRPQVVRPAVVEWVAAAAKTVLAMIGFWLLIPFVHRGDAMVVGVTGMLAGVLLFHSGLFHLMALAWQKAGRSIRPIMNAPLAASSLADFWGRRWNLAFRDAAALLVFRPTARRWGAAVATLITFLVSGILHDAVISLPARGGYGLPTLYFLVQYVGLMCERITLRGELSCWKRLANRVTTALVVVLPLPLLFHRPFAENVIVPLLQELKLL